MKVLISDPIAEDGIKILREAGLEVIVKTGLSKDELIEELKKGIDAIIIRSATKMTADVIEAAPSLKVIARAGTGLDNVDIDAANRKGIVVMNCPGGNTVSAAEHTIAMMMALARNIPQATASMKAGKWEKKKFMGREVNGKTLGVIGLGRIGSIVADRAKGLKMRVIAYDPFVNPEQAAKMGIEVMSLDELLPQADFITIHVPLTKETKGFINKEKFDKMKDGVMLIHCARGGIVNESDLYEAMVSGKVAGAALDVFEQEPPPPDYPLFKLENFICTPHLGASTLEAQKNVALAVASQVVDFLVHGVVRNAVNMPSVSAELLPTLKPYLKLAEKLGAIQAQLAEGPVQEVHIEYQGDVANLDTKPLTVALLKGLLTPALREDVNYVNAPIRAKERGIKVTESKVNTAEDFLNLIKVVVKFPGGENLVAGTIFGKKEPRIVQINDFRLDAIPEGHMLYLMNEDKPGVIGQIGITIGEHGLNISRMHVGQDPAQQANIILLCVDKPVPEDLLEKLKTLPPVKMVKPLELV
ncbi:phosphoglycerate dehydrogenase [Thermodesulfatator autotrophicus]|uniref:D-3-phosphoglycerate dehydrogenase n=1 Tax=Thermodesulfatator autotrophicus TaxID=1795632 RepID=A0A177E5X8_9BACT|nr:phosphoglycerate dehydrogenase [Thermodesulfatator autotrophicus]OAG27305.1 3-phosphoglycerate dehydrogenase [Thermodesulfatator autotrophicus]